MAFKRMKITKNVHQMKSERNLKIFLGFRIKISRIFKHFALFAQNRTQRVENIIV